MRILLDFARWQLYSAPAWFVKFLWHLHLVLVKVFSVGHLLRTLVSHWHRDAVPYTGGTISHLAMTIAWNITSRFIGFSIRASILLFWCILELIYIPLALALLAVLFLWPALAAGALVSGFSLLFAAQL